jgi:hypothetical protein
MKIATMRGRLALAAALGLLVGVARAEVAATSSTGFTVVERRDVHATPADLGPALAAVSAWWNEAHTFSHKASNLSLATAAGSCFCERWATGSVQHAQVIYADTGVVRLLGALGPLQGLAVQGVLSFRLAEAEKPGAPNVLEITYRIGGGEAADMQRWPALVDKMMSDTADHLAKYLDR